MHTVFGPQFWGREVANFATTSGNLWALLLVSNMGQRKKKLATSSDLGAFWSILGTVLEHSGVVLERSGVVLEHSGVVLMSSGVVLEHSGGLLDHSVGCSGTF